MIEKHAIFSKLDYKRTIVVCAFWIICVLLSLFARMEDLSASENICKVNLFYPTEQNFRPGSPFCSDRGGSAHQGLDIPCTLGSNIYAASDGVVEDTCDYYVEGAGCSGWGSHVKLRGTSITTIYGHLESIVVSTGQTVRQRQLIGKCGTTGRSSGPHLHFEVRGITSTGGIKIEDPARCLGEVEDNYCEVAVQNGENCSLCPVGGGPEISQGPTGPAPPFTPTPGLDISTPTGSTLCFPSVAQALQVKAVEGLPSQLGPVFAFSTAPQEQVSGMKAGLKKIGKVFPVEAGWDEKGWGSWIDDMPNPQVLERTSIESCMDSTLTDVNKTLNSAAGLVGGLFNFNLDLSNSGALLQNMIDTMAANLQDQMCSWVSDQAQRALNNTTSQLTDSFARLGQLQNANFKLGDNLQVNARVGFDQRGNVSVGTGFTANVPYINTTATSSMFQTFPLSGGGSGDGGQPVRNTTNPQPRSNTQAPVTRPVEQVLQPAPEPAPGRNTTDMNLLYR